MRFYSCYAFDLDGTLYRGQEPVPGAVSKVQSLVERGAQVLYVTNNSGLTQAEYVSKLTKMGFPAGESQVVTSALAAADYCSARELRRLFVVGEPGLVATLRSQGFEVVNAPDSDLVRPSDASADALVSGICRDALSYALLDSAMQAALQSGVYVACNADLTYPLEGGRICPGSGSIVAALQACSGVTPVVVGKPAPDMLTSALGRLGVSPLETLVVGDRVDTDIECGRAAGCDTVLVLSGVAREAVEGVTCLGSVLDL